LLIKEKGKSSSSRGEISRAGIEKRVAIVRKRKQGLLAGEMPWSRKKSFPLGDPAEKKRRCG